MVFAFLLCSSNAWLLFSHHLNSVFFTSSSRMCGLRFPPRSNKTWFSPSSHASSTNGCVLCQIRKPLMTQKQNLVVCKNARLSHGAWICLKHACLSWRKTCIFQPLLHCVLNYAPPTPNSLHRNILAVDLVTKKQEHLWFVKPLISPPSLHTPLSAIEPEQVYISFIKSDIALGYMLYPNVRCVV